MNAKERNSERKSLINAINEERFGLNQAVRMLIEYVDLNDTNIAELYPNFKVMYQNNTLNARTISAFWSFKDENGVCLQKATQLVNGKRFNGYKVKTKWSIADVLQSVVNSEKDNFESKVVSVDEWIASKPRTKKQ